jgi:hypothetical protein
MALAFLGGGLIVPWKPKISLRGPRHSPTLDYHPSMANLTKNEKLTLFLSMMAFLLSEWTAYENHTVEKAKNAPILEADYAAWQPPDTKHPTWGVLIVGIKIPVLSTPNQRKST